MENKIIDHRVTKENKVQFKKNGWTLVDLRLSRDTIKKALGGLKQMRNNSIKTDYKLRRIYYDHFFSNNTAAIELPFNKEICNENVRNLFYEAKIGSLIKTIMDWDNPCCDLARLFCMNNFKYRGNWHRDYESNLNNIQLSSATRDYILVGIYLLPQKGFRILKKEFEYNGRNSVVPNKSIDKAIRSFSFPLLPKDGSFDVVNGEIGTALFFDPFLLHQGSSYNERLDFHMKFFNNKKSKIIKNKFQDFCVTEILHENYELKFNSNSLKDRKLENIPFHKRSTIIQRLTNTIDYRTCFRRVFKIRNLKSEKYYNNLKKNGWKIDNFSNTIFQK